MGIENQILLKENPQPGVLRLIMNDPKRKNALSENMIDALTDTIVSSSEVPYQRYRTAVQICL